MAALTFVLSKGKLPVVLGVWIICMALNMAAHGHLLPEGSWHSWLGPVGDGGLAALVLGGAITSMLFRSLLEKGRRIPVIGWLTLIAVILLAAGIMTRPYWGSRK